MTRTAFAAREAALEALYLADLTDLGLRPGDPLLATCPSCGVGFWIRLPMRRPRATSDGFMSLCCPAPCGHWGTLRSYSPNQASADAASAFDAVTTCSRCGIDFAVNGVVYRRPCCAIETPREAMQLAAQDLHTRAQSAALSREDLESMLARLVSTFDGVMRHMVAISHANDAFRATSGPVPPYPWFQRLPDVRSFQNLEGARTKLLNVDYDIGRHSRWSDLVRLFQKRHLCAHKLGVVDAAYLRTTRDPDAKLGKLVSLSPGEIVDGGDTCVDIVVGFFGYWLS